MNTRNHKDGEDEVEDLLRQAQDAALLKLSVNGHMAHLSSSDLPPDLSHRFQCLKSRPSTTKPIATSTKATIVKDEVGQDLVSSLTEDDPDDLLARFAALKASLPKQSSSSSSSVDPVKEQINEKGDFNDKHEDEDEVDKIMRWAVDAARLDPSPDSDDDGSEAAANDSDSDFGTSEEDDDYGNKKKEKKQT